VIARATTVPTPDPAAVLAARRESERRRQASLRQDAAHSGGGNFSMTLRAADAAALGKICKRDGCTRSAAVRAALVAYAASGKAPPQPGTTTGAGITARALHSQRKPS
jgi:hypothetical protein